MYNLFVFSFTVFFCSAVELAQSSCVNCVLSACGLARHVSSHLDEFGAGSKKAGYRVILKLVFLFLFLFSFFSRIVVGDYLTCLGMDINGGLAIFFCFQCCHGGLEVDDSLLFLRIVVWWWSCIYII